MKSSDEFQLTQEDKDRYEKRISEIDLNDIPMVLKEIPQKIEKLDLKVNIFSLILTYILGKIRKIHQNTKNVIYSK